MKKNCCQFVFLQSDQMPGIYDGMRRRKFALNKDK